MKNRPSFLDRYRTRKRARRLMESEHSFTGLTNEQVFEKIYADGSWGTDSEGRPWSGSGSHTPHIVHAYVEAVVRFLERLGANLTVVDLGCGDFSVGARIAPAADHYIACDIAPSIIDRNSRLARHGSVAFRTLDLVTDDLPAGDVALVRQVLQHLCNDDIRAFSERVSRTRPYRYLIVTEHIPAAKRFPANVDIPSGSWTRVMFGSGVVLEKPPFSLRSLSRETLCEVREPSYDRDAIIRTVCYRLK